MTSIKIVLCSMACALAFIHQYHCTPIGYNEGLGGGLGGYSAGAGGYSGGAGGYSGGGGGYGGGGYQEDDHHDAKPYAFGYAVKDFKKGTDFNQHESSDGHNVHGQYTVQLPDGRTQVVSYKADWKNGFHADVKYVGEAHHPEVYGHGDLGGGYGGSGSYGGGYESSAGSSSGGAYSTNFQNLGGSDVHGGYGSGNAGYESGVTGGNSYASSAGSY